MRRFPAHLLRLWLDPRVSREKKLIFPVLVLAYWLLPDVAPFIPIDDLLFTMLMTYWFTRSAQKDIPEGDGKFDSRQKGRGKYVDVQAEVVDDVED